MFNLIKSIGIVFLMVSLQFGLYLLLFNSNSSAWGATEEEVAMTMEGDNIAPFITSTRAITIDAPVANVWQWVMQIGADRGGFYSYYFIEEAMGYITREQQIIKAEFNDFVVGDVVRGSIKEEKSLIVYRFPVVSVKHEQYLILENWGTFLLKKIDDKQTRLIVRTHGRESDNILFILLHKVEVAMHFLMERRTLMGIKSRAEAGESPAFDETADKYWFTGVVLSAMMICLIIFISRGLSALYISFAVSFSWLLLLYQLPPAPIFSFSLFFILVIISGWLKYSSFNQHVKLKTKVLEH